MKKDNKKTKETPRYANDNLNQGRSQKRIEETYKVVEWVFVLAFIGLFIVAIHYSFLYIK